MTRLTSADLFSGIGGMALGFRQAGFSGVYASEFSPAARLTFVANAEPGTQVDPRDVREVSAADILKDAGLRAGDLHCLTGGPPCQAFSMSGTQKPSRGLGREREYAHGATQKDADLFAEFIRLRDGLRPWTFVAENVPGLARGVAKGYFLEVLGNLRKGYRVEVRLLDAQWLGVPQRRERLVFVGVRDDLGLDPAFPAPLASRPGVREALANPPARARIEPETDISRYAIGREWDRLNPGQQSDRYFNLFRAPLDEPCQTITAAAGEYLSGASVTHPTEKRKFATWELKRLCGFPDGFKLRGDYAENYRGMGNCVPPPMARSIAEAIRDAVILPALERGKRTAKSDARGTRRAPSRRATAKEASQA